ncbi:MAG: ATP phosphoribosyltransferase [Ruminococcaceae bacterium]|nr:ATP phosphoribosyltransferase [Oscillospiraceae bacterium]
MLNIALPKGRLGKKVYSLFAEIGYDCEDIFEDNRKLIFENSEGTVRYFLVKPSDVAIYVERGAADIGVVGKDILLETEPDVYELLDLKLGKCKMAVAAKNGWVENPDEPLRVATKFVNIAKTYYNSINREIDVIKLHGSIELAPILDMSDVIVDIVETGTTLKENDLKVYTEILPISARFIANKNAFRFKNDIIMKINTQLAEKIG